MRPDRAYGNVVAAGIVGGRAVPVVDEMLHPDTADYHSALVSADVGFAVAGEVAFVKPCAVGGIGIGPVEEQGVVLDCPCGFAVGLVQPAAGQDDNFVIDLVVDGVFPFAVEIFRSYGSCLGQCPG